MKKSVIKGLVVAGLLAGATAPAHAVAWGGNGNYCAGSLFETCFSIDLQWTDNVATLTVQNLGSEGDLIKAIGITNLPAGFTYVLSGQAGYCAAGNPGCPNEIGGAPLSGNGQYPLAAVAATNDQGSMPGDGESGTWIFTFSGITNEALNTALAGANVGGHFISGNAAECSTKWEVTSTDEFNSGPFDPECAGETVVPEPATMLLLATGLVGLSGATIIRRRKQQNS